MCSTVRPAAVLMALALMVAPSSSTMTGADTANNTGTNTTTGSNTTSTTSLCDMKCSAYYAGATASDPLVCKYKASGACPLLASTIVASTSSCARRLCCGS